MKDAVSLFTSCLRGRFLRRPNRFAAEVRLEETGGGGSGVGGSERDRFGGEERVFCPNPGRLLELLVPGVPVLLEKNRRPGKTRWTLAAVEYRGEIIPLYSARANRLAEELILPRWFPGAEIRREFTPRRMLPRRMPSREAAAGEQAGEPAGDSAGHRSRFDFLVSVSPGESAGGRGDPPRLVEVKACTLAEEGTAMFPDAPSSRAARHTAELAEWVSRGEYRGMILFVLLNPRAERMVPNLHTDPVFARTLMEASERVELRAVRVRGDETGMFRTAGEVPVDLEGMGPAVLDSGVYLAVLKLAEGRRIRVGALGDRFFPRGYYVYTGSARSGLGARTGRHRRKRKKKHWHIDYLRAETDLVRILEIRTPRDLEEELAREVGAAAGEGGAEEGLSIEGDPAEAGRRAAAGFGAGDSRCSSHLTFWPENPLENRAFLEVLLEFRHRRWREGGLNRPG